VLVADEQTDHRVTKPGRLMSDVPAMLADKRGLADVVFAQDQDQVLGGEAPRVRVELRKAGRDGLQRRRVELGQIPLEHLDRLAY